MSRTAGVQLTRNVAAITMNYTVEGVNVRTLGGVDIVTTDDLAGLKTVGVDLGADATPDTVIANGTDKARPRRPSRATGDAGRRRRASPATTRISGSESRTTRCGSTRWAAKDDVSVDPNAELLITPVIDLGTGQ